MVAAAIVGTGLASAAVASSSASKAQKSQDNATAAASAAADREADLAQEQWEYQRDVYLPKAQKRDDEQWALTSKVANQQLDDAAHYRDISDQAFDQAKKSYKYQDQYMGLADDYSSGKMANTMADEANADVEQAYGTGLQDMTRQAARYGINPGSNGFSSAIGDLYNDKMLASAGGQTAARRYARDKAEQMVGIAAGAGQAGFGTGLSAGGLATGASSAAVGATNSGVGNGNSVASTFNSGMSAAGTGFGNSSAAWNNVARTSGNSPTADFFGGLTSSAIRVGSANGWFSPTSYTAPNAFGVYSNPVGSTYSYQGATLPNELRGGG